MIPQNKQINLGNFKFIERKGTGSGKNVKFTLPDTNSIYLILINKYDRTYKNQAVVFLFNYCLTTTEVGGNLNVTTSLNNNELTVNINDDYCVMSLYKI